MAKTVLVTGAATVGVMLRLSIILATCESETAIERLAISAKELFWLCQLRIVRSLSLTYPAIGDPKPLPAAFHLLDLPSGAWNAPTRFLVGRTS